MECSYIVIFVYINIEMFHLYEDFYYMGMTTLELHSVIQTYQWRMLSVWQSLWPLTADICAVSGVKY